MSKKRLAEFAAVAANKVKSIFDRGVYLGENTYQAKTDRALPCGSAPRLSKKRLAEFAAVAANKVKSIFDRGVYLGENTYQAASVEFVRHRLSKKRLAEFAAVAANKVKSIFDRGVYLGENTYQAASVEFVRQRRTNYARSRLQKPVEKPRGGFFSTGACTWAKILIRLQVWNLFANGGQIMHAADCKNLSKSPVGDFRQPRTPWRKQTARVFFYLSRWDVSCL